MLGANVVFVWPPPHSKICNNAKQRSNSIGVYWEKFGAGLVNALAVARYVCPIAQSQTVVLWRISIPNDFLMNGSYISSRILQVSLARNMFEMQSFFVHSEIVRYII